MIFGMIFILPTNWNNVLLLNLKDRLLDQLDPKIGNDRHFAAPCKQYQMG